MFVYRGWLIYSVVCLLVFKNTKTDIGAVNIIGAEGKNLV